MLLTLLLIPPRRQWQAYRFIINYITMARQVRQAGKRLETFFICVASLTAVTLK